MSIASVFNQNLTSQLGYLLLRMRVRLAWLINKDNYLSLISYIRSVPVQTKDAKTSDQHRGLRTQRKIQNGALNPFDYIIVNIFEIDTLHGGSSLEKDATSNMRATQLNHPMGF